MTSRDVSRARFQDQLDIKIRWVLQTGVGRARPPSGVWGRIVDRLTQQASTIRAGSRRGYQLACRGLALWLFDVAVGPPSEFAYRYSPRLGDGRDKHYLRLLMYQCDLGMQILLDKNIQISLTDLIDNSLALFSEN